jgi:E2F/DP family winged-helix DNA-binding domain.
MMLSSTSMSATITPFDPCKRMKISVPTPPLPGARNRSGSAFLPTEARSVAQVNQYPLPLVHTSKSEGNSGRSTSSTCIEKENMPSFVSMMQGSIPSGMSSLYNNVKDHSCQGMMLQNTSNDANLDIPPNQQLLPDGTYKRKDKSLGVLCVNFMLRYDKMKALNPQVTPSVSIDEASAYLAVERRRIYDIINILESINIVSRKCKNTYNWHGMDGILDTFFALQKEGVRNFEQDAINSGFKAKMEEMGIDYREEESSSKAQEGNEHKCHVSSMPTGLAMLLAGGKFLC